MAVLRIRWATYRHRWVSVPALNCQYYHRPRCNCMSHLMHHWWSIDIFAINPEIARWTCTRNAMDFRSRIWWRPDDLFQVHCSEYTPATWSIDCREDWILGNVVAMCPIRERQSTRFGYSRDRCRAPHCKCFAMAQGCWSIKAAIFNWKSIAPATNRCFTYSIVHCIENGCVFRHKRWQTIQSQATAIDCVHRLVRADLVFGQQIWQMARAILQFRTCVAYFTKVLST